MTQRKKKKTKKATKRKATTAKGLPIQLPVLAGIIALLSIFVYSPTFQAEITNWDDESYLLKTTFIQEINAENMKEIWTTRVKSNYHPLTMLSYAIEYEIAGEASPKLVHTTNLAFHILASLLLLYFIFLLSGRWEIAGITAALFALHPMHVESVAWMSERKDVLYAFFYIAGLICYLKSIRIPAKKMKWLGFALLAFLASCLSKGMAVSFPLVLLLIDFLEKRILADTKEDLKMVLLEKIPFFVISIIFGAIVLFAQGETGAVEMVDTVAFGGIDRIFIACYGLMTYLWKLFVPINLSALYVYPEKIDGMLPILFYASIIPVLGLAVFILFNLKKYRQLAFGIGFFIATILMVSQIIPVGRAILAERYSYIPYIGLAYFIGYGFVYLIEKKPTLKMGLTALLLVWVAGLTYLANQRAKVWQNSETLWTDVIEKQPRAVLAYHNLSYHYKSNGLDSLAVPMYDRGLAVDPNHLGLLVNRGSHNYKLKNLDIAMKDFDKALSIDPNHKEALLNRGAVYHMKNKTDLALTDYNKVLEIDPKEPKILLNRGMLYSKMSKLDLALVDLNACLEVQPNYDFAHLQRSKVYLKMGNKAKALQDANKAKALGYKVSQDYMKKLQ